MVNHVRVLTVPERDREELERRVRTKTLPAPPGRAGADRAAVKLRVCRGGGNRRAGGVLAAYGCRVAATLRRTGLGGTGKTPAALGAHPPSATPNATTSCGARCCRPRLSWDRALVVAAVGARGRGVAYHRGPAVGGSTASSRGAWGPSSSPPIPSWRPRSATWSACTCSRPTKPWCCGES